MKRLSIIVLSIFLVLNSIDAQRTKVRLKRIEPAAQEGALIISDENFLASWSTNISWADELLFLGLDTAATRAWVRSNFSSGNNSFNIPAARILFMDANGSLTSSDSIYWESGLVVDGLALDNGQTRIVVWDSVTKRFEYRQASTLVTSVLDLQAVTDVGNTSTNSISVAGLALTSLVSNNTADRIAVFNALDGLDYRDLNTMLDFSGLTQDYYYSTDGSGNLVDADIFVQSAGNQSVFIGDDIDNTTAVQLVAGGWQTGRFATGTNNVLFGFRAGRTSTGDDLTAFGRDAGTNNTGNYNTTIGALAGFSIDGNDNFIAGRNAGRVSGLVNHRIIIGQGAGEFGAGGNNDILIGQQVGVRTRGGIRNIGIGYQAMGDTTANRSIAIGMEAGEQIGNVNYAVLIGDQAGRQVDGHDMIGIGRIALETAVGEALIGIGEAAGENAISTEGIFMGTQAGQNTNGNQSVFLGNLAGRNSTGNGNVFLGQNAGQGTDGETNVGIGQNALIGSDQNDAVGIGKAAGAYSSGSNGLIAIGDNAAYTAPNSTRAVMIGFRAGYLANDSPDAVMIGNASGQNAESNLSVIIGKSAGFYDQGSYNVMIGEQAGQGTSDLLGIGNTNIFIGREAGEEFQSANNSIGIGYRALEVIAANLNIALGLESQNDNVSGIGNVSLGTQSMRYLIDGDYNIGLGYLSGAGGFVTNETLSNTMGLGREANPTNNGEIIIGNATHYSNTIFPQRMTLQSVANNNAATKIAALNGVDEVVYIDDVQLFGNQLESFTSDGTKSDASLWDENEKFPFVDASGDAKWMTADDFGAIVSRLNRFFHKTHTSGQNANSTQTFFGESYEGFRLVEINGSATQNSVTTLPLASTLDNGFELMVYCIDSSGSYDAVINSTSGTDLVVNGSQVSSFTMSNGNGYRFIIMSIPGEGLKWVLFE